MERSKNKLVLGVAILVAVAAGIVLTISLLGDDAKPALNDAEQQAATDAVREMNQAEQKNAQKEIEPDEPDTSTGVVQLKRKIN